VNSAELSLVIVSHNSFWRSAVRAVLSAGFRAATLRDKPKPKAMLVLVNIGALNRLGAAGRTSEFPELPKRASSRREWSLAIGVAMAPAAPASILYMRMLLPAPHAALLGLSPAYAW
jgi:hypothetical protein